MPGYSQLQGILSARNELDDQYNSKTVFQFSPLQGKLDGSNAYFQIPAGRIVVYSDSLMSLFPQIYKNDTPLVFGTDYELEDPILGLIHYLLSTAIPTEGDEVKCTFNYVWFTDIEWDHHLNRAAGEIGFTQYYTSSSSVPGTESLPTGGSLPTDIPDGLFSAIIYLGVSLAARALSLRFSTKYDTSAGDQSFSPSQMAKSFTDIADQYEKKAYAARDDFWKGQSRQYKPAILPQGYILPPWTPPR